MVWPISIHSILLLNPVTNNYSLHNQYMPKHREVDEWRLTQLMRFVLCAELDRSTSEQVGTVEVTLASYYLKLESYRLQLSVFAISAFTKLARKPGASRS